MNNLIHGVAASAGRMMSLATVASCHVWLGLTALSKKDREDLLGAPVSAEGLFGPISSVTQCFSRLEEERVQLSRMLPLALPQAPQRTPPRASLQARERSATVRRRERRWHGAPVPAAPSTSSAHPVEPAYRHSQGRSSREWPGGVLRLRGADWRGEEASRRGEKISPPGTPGRIPPPPCIMHRSLRYPINMRVICI